MTNILGIAGSWRTGSFNAALLKAARELAPESSQIEIASIREIPLYDGDVEANQGLPPPVIALKERLCAADGLLLVTPEYNNSLPGTLKNTIDWLSRPASDIPRVFGGRPVGVIGATPGRGGTRMAQVAWLPVLRVLGAQPYFGHPIALAEAGKVFDGDGRLVDERTRTALRSFMAGFVAFTRAVADSSDRTVSATPR